MNHLNGNEQRELLWLLMNHVCKEKNAAAAVFLGAFLWIIVQKLNNLNSKKNKNATLELVQNTTLTVNCFSSVPVTTTKGGFVGSKWFPDGHIVFYFLLKYTNDVAAVGQLAQLAVQLATLLADLALGWKNITPCSPWKLKLLSF